MLNLHLDDVTNFLKARLMRKLIFLIVILSTALVIASCKKNNDDTILISLLEKSWTQSYEENTSESYNVYRPSDYKDFPPSRFRQVFNLKENNICDYLVLALNDGHYMENGNWEYDEKTNIIKIMNKDLIVLYEFEIIELKNDLLKLSSY